MNLMQLSQDQTTEMADTFSLLSDPSRLSIVLACAEAEHSVGEIAERLGLSSSLVSHHLRLLKAARILSARRDGKHIFYTLEDDCVRNVLKIMSTHIFNHHDKEI